MNCTLRFALLSRTVHAGTSSMLSFRFNARAALSRVARVIEGFAGSSRRFPRTHHSFTTAATTACQIIMGAIALDLDELIRAWRSMSMPGASTFSRSRPATRFDTRTEPR